MAYEIRYTVAVIQVIGAEPPATLPPLDGRPESLSTRVYESIRDAIVSKTLSPGMRLSEAGLADQLMVSKTPVREALLRLQAIGLVVIKGNRGLQVVTPSRDRIRFAYEVRGGHEFTAARLAADRAGNTEITQLDLAAQESVTHATRGDAPGFREWDAVFHRLVAGAAANPLLAELVENSFALTWALRRRDALVTGDSIDCAHQHVAIVAAIRERDVERAGSTMLAHVDKVMTMVLIHHPE